MDRPPLPATAAGLLLALGCAIAGSIAAYRYSSKSTRPHRSMLALAAGGLVFQVVHVLEHLLQLGFWFARPGDTPWLSSWASGTADGLQYFCSLVPSADTPTSLGVEMLHLTGNIIFLGALTAWQVAMRAQGQSIASLNTAERIQLFHVLEHVLLVGTLVGFGTARGLSTMFGLVDGSALVALRVWFHFGINALATGWALRAAWHTWGRPLKDQSPATPAEPVDATV